MGNAGRVRHVVRERNKDKYGHRMSLWEGFHGLPYLYNANQFDKNTPSSRQRCTDVTTEEPIVIREIKGRGVNGYKKRRNNSVKQKAGGVAGDSHLTSAGYTSLHHTRFNLTCTNAPTL